MGDISEKGVSHMLDTKFIKSSEHSNRFRFSMNLQIQNRTRDKKGKEGR